MQAQKTEEKRQPSLLPLVIWKKGERYKAYYMKAGSWYKNVIVIFKKHYQINKSDNIFLLSGSPVEPV